MRWRPSAYFEGASYALLGSGLSLTVSVLVVTIVPRFFGVTEYGYLQLFVLYSTFAAVLHLGWADGVYLQTGGKPYGELKKGTLFSQFWMLTIYTGIVCAALALGTLFLVTDRNYSTVLYLVVLWAAVVTPRSLLVSLLQSTNRIKDYTFVIVADRVVYATLVVAVIAVGGRSFELLVSADITGKVVSLLLAARLCRDMVFLTPKNFAWDICGAVGNVRVGSKVVLAYISSVMVVGIVRFAIEDAWDIETFGRVSLTLNVSGMVVGVLSAVGLAVYPVLSRVDFDAQARIMKHLGFFGMTSSLALLPLYFPIYAVASAWLPAYASGLSYMALLFPIVVSETMMGVLISPFLKAVRRERALLVVNVVVVVLSLGLTWLAAYVLKNLTMTVIVIPILLVVRWIMSETLLWRSIGVTERYSTWPALVLVTIFSLSSWFVGGWRGLALYLIAFSAFLILHRKEIVASVRYIRVRMTL